MMRKGPLAWMVDHGVAPNLMMVLFIVGGLMASLAIKKEVFPEFETEIVQVTISYPGATPEDVEQSLLLPVEAAIADVEGTLARERSAALVQEAQSVQLEASRLVYKEAHIRYEGGLASYQQLLSALDSYQNAQLSMLATKRDRIDARVSLHEALGGEWTRQFPSPETKR